MVPFRDIRMDLMSSKEVAQYLKKKQAVLLPVGCFEMHGPRVPLACDSFIDWAGALLLGERWRIPVMPPIYYTFPGASGPWPGTVDISPEITIAYVKEIVKALLKNGFRQVMLCGSHGPLAAILKSVTASIFQETGEVVIHICPWNLLLPQEEVEKEFGPGIDRYLENLFVLGALKILGLHGAFDPKTRKRKPIEFPLPAIRKLAPHAGSGCVPWLFVADHQHTGLYDRVSIEDADRIVAMMRKAADSLPDLPGFFAEYQTQVASALKKKPWAKKDVWSA